MWQLALATANCAARSRRAKAQAQRRPVLMVAWIAGAGASARANSWLRGAARGVKAADGWAEPRGVSC